MDRDTGVLVDILIAARDIVEFKEGATKEEFLRSKLLRSVVYECDEANLAVVWTICERHVPS